MPEPNAPRGQVKLADAVAHLHQRGLYVSKGMIYKYVEAGRLNRYGPEKRNHKYYSLAELDQLADEELGIGQRLDANFARASLDDLKGIYRVSEKIFNTPTVSPISVEQKRTWLLKEPRGHYVVKRTTGEILAWLHITPVSDAFLADYMAGNKTGTHLIAADIRPFTPGIPANCIVVSIASDPDLEKKARPRCMSILLHGVSLDIALWGLQGIIISRLYAWSETKSGIALCARMGMQQFNPPFRATTKDGKPGPWRYSFYLDVLNSPKLMVRGYQRALHEWQTSNPQWTTEAEEDLPPAWVPGSPNPIKQRQPGPSQAAHQVNPIKQRQPGSASSSTPDSTYASPEDLPAGTVHLQDFLAAHGLKDHRRKVLGYLEAPRNGLRHEAFKKPNRDEHDRYLTPDQQDQLLSWLQAHHADLFQP
ncbi:MAG: hypothetical protein J2P37_00240 [Ktedonobacteraceae bacterium]|nr:hypothetical protein [Ktedonobacteraceae bacterium]